MSIRILKGNVLDVLPTLGPGSAHCVVTSPPHWGLRDYGLDGQIGLEATPEEHVEKMVAVFREVRRVLRDDGTAWVNYGDCYATGAGAVGACPGGGKQGEAWKSKGRMTSPNRMPISGLKPKDLVGMPWRVAFALQADGWYLRSDIIWHKPNPMPESVTDRPTKSHEYIFLLAKQARYYYNADAVREVATYAGKRVTLGEKSLSKGQAKGAGISPSGNGKAESVTVGDTHNIRTVWTVPTAPFPGAHFATFPPALIEPCIKAGCPAGGMVLDPFGGAGTTGLVADRLGRSAILVELNAEYAEMARKRIVADCPMFADCTIDF